MRQEETIEYRCGSVQLASTGSGLDDDIGFNTIGKSFVVYFEHECRQMYMYARSVWLWYISLFGNSGMQ
jgi:hypothetical protein